MCCKVKLIVGNYHTTELGVSIVSMRKTWQIFGQATMVNGKLTHHVNTLAVHYHIRW